MGVLLRQRLSQREGHCSLRFQCCAAMGDEELYEVLTAVKGIGRSPYSVTTCWACSSVSWSFTQTMQCCLPSLSLILSGHVMKHVAQSSR